MYNKLNPMNIYKAFLLSCLIGCVLVVFGMTGMRVQAKEENAFFIDAELVGDHSDTYDIQVTIQNPGKDWEGTARVLLEENYRLSTAYDTKISLPEGSEKQFVVKIPKVSIENTKGTVRVFMVDKKERLVWDEVFYHLLSDGRMAVHLGILSDEYAQLTYLDLNGNVIYYQGDDYPIKLNELDQANLLEKLESLQYLVIDAYDTSVLTDEEVDAIGQWCDNGGILIIGTGEYAEETLGSLSERLVEIECYEINEPGSYGQYYQYNDMIDWSTLHMATLMEMAPGIYYNEMYSSAATCYNHGDGMIVVTPYSLKELGQQSKAFYQDEYSYMDRTVLAQEMLQEATHMSIAGSYSDYNDKGYRVPDSIRTMLRAMGAANSELDFAVLKWIVVIYVIFVGPLLYLILKGMKKREAYWGAVVLTVVVTMLFIYLAGRGHEVRNTRVFSVTTENLADMSKSKSYLYAYDASHDEWLMDMQEGYEYAGKLGAITYYYSDKEGAYDSRVVKEGDRISVGVVPQENFENTYFVLGYSNNAERTGGSLTGTDIYEDWGELYGTITNNTEYDFPYYAVIVDNLAFIFRGLNAGESLNLHEQYMLFQESDGDNYFGLYENHLYSEYRDGYMTAEELTALSALGVGMYNSCLEHDNDAIVLIGLIPDSEKTVDDNVNEMSYRCVYQIQ